MAMPDISFKNNVGSIAFKRATVGISDSYQWDGSTVTKTKHISVNAHVSRDAAENLSGLSTSPAGQATYGQRGTLTLPWTILSNLKIDSLEWPEQGWQDDVEVHASFTDDGPQNNLYTVNFCGYTVHYPRFSLPVPVKRTSDEFMQIPMSQNGLLSSTNPHYGPIRFRQGCDMMQLTLAGTVFFEDGKLPDGFLATLSMRKGVGGAGEGYDTGSLPVGYPIVFGLSAVIPEIAESISINSCIVASSRVSWNVENQSARVMLSMLTQPQAWVGV